jgi:hypothetical protein
MHKVGSIVTQEKLLGLGVSAPRSDFMEKFTGTKINPDKFDASNI